MSKRDIQKLLKVKDIQVWQPSMAPALVPVVGENTLKI